MSLKETLKKYNKKLKETYIDPIAAELSGNSGTTEATYNERATGSEYNTVITDASSASVVKVEGNTVRTTNEFNTLGIAVDTLSVGGSAKISSVTEDTITISVLTSAALHEFILGSGIKILPYLYPYYNYYYSYNLSAGTMIMIHVKTLSGEYVMLEQGQLLNSPLDTLAEDCVKLTIFGAGEVATGETIEIKNLMIAKNASAEFTPFFSGLKNAGFQGIESTGVGGNNLFDRDYIINGYSQSGGNATTTKIVVSGEASIAIIPCEPNKKYYFTRSKFGLNDLFRFFYYDTYPIVNETVSIGGQYKTNALSFNFTTPANAKYVVFSLQTTAVVNETDYMLSYENLPYEPYKKSRLKLPKSIDNPLGQRIDFYNQKMINNGCDKILDGTETGFAVYKYSVLPGGIGTPKNKYGIAKTDDSNFMKPSDISGGATVINSEDFLRTGNDDTKSYMWCGYSNTPYFYWINIIDILGFTSDWVDWDNPTTAEKNAAIVKFKAWLAARNAAGNPVTIRYLSRIYEENAFTLEQAAAGDSYLAYNQGTEKVIGNDNATWGAVNTITQTYDLTTMSTKIDELADTKLDKKGGYITGNLYVQGDLSVAGKTNTVDQETLTIEGNVIVANGKQVDLVGNSGLAINKNTSETYGIMLDPTTDTVNLGVGIMSEDGEFTFNEGEAQAVATRGEIANGNIPQWSTAKNTFIDSGKKVSDIETEISNVETTLNNKLLNKYDKVNGITINDYTIAVNSDESSNNSTLAPGGLQIGNNVDGFINYGVAGISRSSALGDYEIIFPEKNGTLVTTDDIKNKYDKVDVVQITDTGISGGHTYPNNTGETKLEIQPTQPLIHMVARLDSIDVDTEGTWSSDSITLIDHKLKSGTGLSSFGLHSYDENTDTYYTQTIQQKDGIIALLSDVEKKYDKVAGVTFPTEAGTLATQEHVAANYLPDQSIVNSFLGLNGNISIDEVLARFKAKSGAAIEAYSVRSPSNAGLTYGYIKYTSGLFIQWGNVNNTATGLTRSSKVTFPGGSYPTINSYVVLVDLVYAGNNYSSKDWVYSKEKDGFTYYKWGAVATTTQWIAIGFAD